VACKSTSSSEVYEHYVELLATSCNKVSILHLVFLHKIKLGFARFAWLESKGSAKVCVNASAQVIFNASAQVIYRWVVKPPYFSQPT